MKKTSYTLLIFLLCSIGLSGCAKDNLGILDFKEYKNLDEYMDNLNYIKVSYDDGDESGIFYLTDKDDIEAFVEILKNQSYRKNKSKIFYGWNTSVTLVDANHKAKSVYICSINHKRYWYHPTNNNLLVFLKNIGVRDGILID
jgi:hypothetical protein